jgi:hypothetical protein
MPFQCSLSVIDVDNPIDTEGLRSLEALLRSPIPEDVIDLYRTAGGGWFPVGAEFETDEGEPVFLEAFHNLRMNQISLEVLREAGYDVLVPFGDTPIGDVLAVSIDQETKGMVYEWLHDEPDDNLRFVSSSLHRFLMSGRINPKHVPENAPPWVLPVVMGDLETLNRLVGQEFGIDSADEKGNTMLLWAVGQRQLPVMKWLLARGANVNAVNARGDSVLHWAIRAHGRDCVRVCLEAGADKEFLNASGYTPLLEAITIGNVRAAKELVQHAANIHFRASDGADIYSLADNRNVAEYVQTLRSSPP